MPEQMVSSDAYIATQWNPRKRATWPPMSGAVRPNSKLKQEKNNAYIDLAQFKLDQRRSHRHSRCAPCHRSGRQRGPAQTPQQERSGVADHDRQVARRPLETRSIL